MSVAALVMFIVALMLAWSVVATTFQTLLALGVLAGVVCMAIVSVAAFVFPQRQRELYQGSPANVNVFGIPVLKIVAPLTFAVVGFLTWETWNYPALALNGNASHRWQIFAFMGGIVVMGLLIYYTSRAVRRSQGVDIDRVRSNCICPGATLPGMSHIGPAADPDQGDDASGWPLAPLGRHGSAADVASVATFLAGDEASFVSGAMLLVDGANGAGLLAGGD